MPLAPHAEDPQKVEDLVIKAGRTKAPEDVANPPMLLKLRDGRLLTHLGRRVRRNEFREDKAE